MIKFGLAVLTAAAAEPPGGVWEALKGATKDNPTITILSLIAGAFSAGFVARKYFQDRELAGLKISLGDAEARLEATSSRIREIDSGELNTRERLKRIVGCLTPSDLKSHLYEHLKHWPSEKHDILIVSIMRQLLATAGSAWLCTPQGTAFVKVEWNDERHACEVSAVMNSQVDPIKELREFAKDPQILRAALFDIAAYGVTSVSAETGPNTVQQLQVRQGPGLSWHLEKKTLQRVKR